LPFHCPVPHSSACHLLSWTVWTSLIFYGSSWNTNIQSSGTNEHTVHLHSLDNWKSENKLYNTSQCSLFSLWKEIGNKKIHFYTHIRS
jgi:hypothetical protein